MSKNIIVTNSSELGTMIQQAVFDAMSQVSLPKKVDPLPEFLDIKQAAAFLNLATPTIYAMCSRREIPHLKRLKKLYFRKFDLEKWLEEGRRKSINENLNYAKNGSAK